MIFTAKRLIAAAVPLLMASATVLVPAVGRADPEPTSALIAAGRQALVRGDGIDAEMKLRAALDRGVPRRQLAAFLGSAYIRQGDRARAREWLASEDFSPETAAEGLRVLAQLEQLDRNLVAAGRAYAKALRITPRDAGLWVEIGRLRYRRGEHLQATQAADHALTLDRRNVRALEFRGQLVRDRHGLLAGLPWFEAALLIAPDDVALLGNYAATLGELGRSSEMLVVTRRMLQLEPGNAQAYYLQAVMAARAGKFDVARSLLARTGGKLGSIVGPLMLQAILELSAGNMRVAAEACERLLKLQPANMRARELLARTLYLSGQYNYLTLRFRGDIARGDASPYLMSVIARAFEAEGNREQAGVLLDRAAAPEPASLRVVPQGSDVGALMSQGRTQDAIAAAEQQSAAQPGSYRSYAIVGDMELALGHAQQAQLQYTAASRIRMSESLLSRRFQAYQATGDAAGAAAMMQSWLAQNPNSRTGLRLQASLALQAGDPATARAILSYLSASGGDQDVQLLSDLALVRLQGGAPDVARQAAGQAYRLQRASPLAAQALALSYATLGVNLVEASALLSKARQMLGDNPIVAQAEARLQQRRLPALATAKRPPR